VAIDSLIASCISATISGGVNTSGAYYASCDNHPALDYAILYAISGGVNTSGAYYASCDNHIVLL
jgi:hypothetical protein